VLVRVCERSSNAYESSHKRRWLKDGVGTKARLQAVTNNGVIELILEVVIE